VQINSSSLRIIPHLKFKLVAIKSKYQLHLLKQFKDSKCLRKLLCKDLLEESKEVINKRIVEVNHSKSHQILNLALSLLDKWCIHKHKLSTNNKLSNIIHRVNLKMLQFLNRIWYKDNNNLSRCLSIKLSCRLNKVLLPFLWIPNSHYNKILNKIDKEDLLFQVNNICILRIILDSILQELNLKEIILWTKEATLHNNNQIKWDNNSHHKLPTTCKEDKFLMALSKLMDNNSTLIFRVLEEELLWVISKCKWCRCKVGNQFLEILSSSNSRNLTNKFSNIRMYTRMIREKLQEFMLKCLTNFK
jgi:hypothetical protein